MNITVKIRNLLVYFITVIILKYIKSIKRETRSKTLLLIRLDAIGDYILFRNFLEGIRKSKKFRDYKITLCGNITWKDIAETLDAAYVDDFIWTDRKMFYGNIKYKYGILKRIHRAGFETVVDMAYSREILYGDVITQASNAKIRIGSQGAQDKHVVWKRNLFSRSSYTEIIQASSEDLFEFCRNKEFVEKLLHEEVYIPKPYIDTSLVRFNSSIKSPYAVLFFGASSKRKIWDIKNFIDVADYLIKNYSFNIALAGGEKEKNESARFINSLPPDKVFDLCGKTTVPELAVLISGAEILLSNESVAVHLAASVNKKFICVSNGERIIRFHPYPKEIFDKAYYVYPEEIERNLNNIKNLNKYRFGSDLDINSITPERVKKKINEAFSRQS